MDFGQRHSKVAARSSSIGWIDTTYSFPAQQRLFCKAEKSRPIKCYTVHQWVRMWVKQAVCCKLIVWWSDPLFIQMRYNLSFTQFHPNACSTLVCFSHCCDYHLQQDGMQQLWPLWEFPLPFPKHITLMLQEQWDTSWLDSTET